MGVSQSNDGTLPMPAAVLSSEQPDVRVEEASEGDGQRVFLEGTMFHDGLNKNAWGLTQEGAEKIANDLLGDDLVAAHPSVRNGKYDRSMTDGPGFPIGEVVSTNVVSVDEAMLDGGEYTAEYVAEVTDPIYASRYQSGQYTNDGYSVSIGIYGDPEAANCSVCDNPMNADACDHERFDEVEVEQADGDTETQIAGPLYDNGHSDHLASVYMAAYEGATAEVDSTASAEAAGDGGLAQASTQTAGDVPAAASVLAAPFDGDGSTSSQASVESASENPDGGSDDDDGSDGYRVQLASAERSEADERDSFKVQL